MQTLKIDNEERKTFNDFLLECKVKNLREETIKDYSVAWREFKKYCYDINNINQKDIENFILNKKGKIKDTSINSYLIKLRAILNYLNADVKIKIPKVDQELKVPYTLEEIKKLLKKPETKKVDFTYYRDWVVINTYMATGIRATSLVNIKNEDVDLDDGVIYIRKLKNRKVTTISMPNILIRVLKEYMAIRKGKPDEYLFCGRFGKKLSVNGLYCSLANYNHSRGVVRTGQHLFRHTFSKFHFALNQNKELLKNILTHSNEKQTDNYLNLLGINLSDGSKNPLDFLVEDKTTIKTK